MSTEINDGSASQEDVAETPQSVVQEPVLTLKDRVFGLFSHPKAPLVVGVAMVVGLAGFVMHRMHVSLPIGRPAIVVFDPVRFVNAQRAAASILASNPSADMTLTLTQVAKQSEAVIREEAHGAVVLVKQAVVVPDDVPDITDAVLERFGLPTSVPTVSTQPSKIMLENVAPTDSSLSVGKLREDYRLELQQRSQQLLADDNKRNKQEQALP
ncbi:glucose-6-phosphate isomerase [Novimethylophilus kurashikiensis]|uniref:Glucose-6-phosphate isomerase n=1 Tax=Novimethylophilus kurashikiensis TaxID=1825523 RepID=A0A2R5FCP6_9PROT|nr:TrbI F-type domain-containing protein [Novimethylophilus kurashikiensis]GBG14414.1 glucose-6-phosphate isomerase [Novimethylophilus kurashikiensis]